jgi:predicted SAM-dependent methyltransferase
MEAKKLNIACGARYHADWVNIDFHPRGNEVKKVNILKGLPFEDSSFEVAYSSHFFEHITSGQAKFVLKEIYRILGPGGIVRIVVPDLENVCREYLQVLDSYDSAEKPIKYKWIVTELLDQMTRNERRGEMGRLFDEAITRDNKVLKDYILHRTGDNLNIQRTKRKRVITLNKIRNELFYRYVGFVKLLLPRSTRDLLFVNTEIGEKHRWMYDRFSLTQMLKEAGFSEVKTETYNSSRIKDFMNYHLDNNEDGTSYKGVHSIYIEAAK